MHEWLVYLHVAGVLGFTPAHGVPARVILRLRSERDPERTRALLEWPGHSYSTMTPF